MKKTVIIPLLYLLMACGHSNSKTNPENVDGGNGNSGSINQPVKKPDITADHGTSYTVEGKEIHTYGSLLVTKDKDHLKPGADYLVILTAAGGGDNNEGLVLNFLLDLKPGTYPVVGWSFHRGPSGQGQLFGGILGGKPALTKYNMNITECKDLGSNNMGGHRWSISGHVDEVVIPAMGLMLMDKTKNHPAEIKIEKASFTNLTFDDNWEEMMKKAGEKMH